MLILATFFPADMSSAGSISVLYEFLKCTVDLADLIGLSIVMRKVSASGVTKVLIAGLGWSTGHFLLSRALPLWVGARGLQFDWQYMLTSLEGNFVLVQHLSQAALVLLWQRLRPLRPHVAAPPPHGPVLPHPRRRLLRRARHCSPLSYALSSNLQFVCYKFTQCFIWHWHIAVTLVNI